VAAPFAVAFRQKITGVEEKVLDTIKYIRIPVPHQVPVC
jgi:hypothetical protein